jgi:hypothetical protein
MIIEELHFELKRRAQLNYTNYWKGMTDLETDSILRSAINDYVEMFAYGRNDKEYKVGFEVTQQRIDMLSTLVVGMPEQNFITPFTSDTNLGIYQFRFEDLEYDYKHLLRAYLIVKECNYIIDVTLEQTGDLNTVLLDDNRKPSLTWRRAVGQIRKSSDTSKSSLYIYTGNQFTPVGLYLEYIKRPQEVCLGTYSSIPTSTTPNPPLKPKVECDLPEDYHDIMLQIALQIYGRTVENQLGAGLAKQRLVETSS